MHPFSWLFLGVVLAALAVQAWLARRQTGHVRAHRDHVPEAFQGRIGLESHQHAADYTVARTRFGLVEAAWGTVILLGLTLGGGLEALDRLWRTAGWGEVATGTGFLVSLGLVTGLLELPFTAYRTFVIEQRFGFNRTTTGLFVTDTLKGALLALVLGAPLAAVVLWLMAHAGSGWWLYAWLVWLGFTFLMVWAYPAVIAPLFNRFTPLENPAVRERIDGLLERTGFAAKGLYVMDGSRRSSHGNAFFAGFGRNRRIVFFDTLLEHLLPEEVEAVLAHELGHFRRRHIRKRLAVTAALSLAGLALLGWLIGNPTFYTALGVSTPSLHAGLALFILVAPVLTFFLHPLSARFSRRHEYEADDFAAEVHDPRDLIRALVKLYQENAATLTPDPVHSAFYDSHPPAPLRIAHLSTKIPG
ncbi:MAG TPA: M48 family metallopeptidase [Gammaproteobacteria bacterium]|nr:M48 family metallopeptidase [Gammaproteobacteria bacterium]